MKKNSRIALRIAGSIGVLFTVFHLFFYQLFNWRETLACLSRDNWAIFQTYHLASILMVGMIAYISLRCPGELATSALGKPLLVVFSLFYLVRIAAEFLFFGFSGGMSLVIIALCAIPALIYLYTLAAGGRA